MSRRIWSVKGPHADRALDDSSTVECWPGSIQKAPYVGERIPSVTIATQSCPRISLTLDAALKLAHELADIIDEARGGK